MRPDLSEVEWIEVEGLSLLKGHYLNIQSPGGVVLSGNAVEQILHTAD